MYSAARHVGWYKPEEKRVEHVGFGVVLGEDKYVCLTVNLEKMCLLSTQNMGRSSIPNKCLSPLYLLISCIFMPHQRWLIKREYMVLIQIFQDMSIESNISLGQALFVFWVGGTITIRFS